ncbi:MAG: hypothetical protein GY804_13435 [Alphaproteobacteria bacterium]|nr:hypothetical protein [Alphaproteobacteria bacterium]
MAKETPNDINSQPEKPNETSSNGGGADFMDALSPESAPKEDGNHFAGAKKIGRANAAKKAAKRFASKEEEKITGNYVDNTNDQHAGVQSNRELELDANLALKLTGVKTEKDDPMDAMFDMLNGLGNVTLSHYLGNLSKRLDHTADKLDHKTLTYKKVEEDLTGTMSGSKDAKTTDEGVFSNVAYWAVHLNAVATDSGLIDGPVLNLSKAERKSHELNWDAEKADNKARFRETNPVKEGDGYFTIFKKEVLGQRFNPTRNRDTVSYVDATNAAINALNNGDKEGLKGFVDASDEIVEKLQSEITETLGIESDDFTLDDLKSAAEQNFAINVEILSEAGFDDDQAKAQYSQLKENREKHISCAEALFAYRRATLLAEQHMLKDEVLQSNEELKEKASTRDDLIAKAEFKEGTNNGAEAAHTGMDNIRDVLRSVYITAQKETKTPGEAKQMFLQNIPDHAGKISNDELVEIGALCAETDERIPSVMESANFVKLSSDEIKKIDNMMHTSDKIDSVEAQMQTDVTAPLREAATDMMTPEAQEFKKNMEDRIALVGAGLER